MNTEEGVDLASRNRQHRLSIIADVLNAFNLRTPTDLTATDIARFGQVAARQGPLRVQLAVAYSY
jgi:hypothetical protein